MSGRFFCASAQWTAGTSPTDIAVFTAGGNGARVRMIFVGASQSGGAGGTVRYRILKRATANTGGTLDSTTVSAARDGGNPGLSVLGIYTAAPTVSGTIIAFRNAPRDIAATGSNWAELNFDGSDEGNRIDLRAGEKLYVNATGLPNAATSYITFEWAEAQ